MKIRFIIYCNHSVISLIISYTCQNFCDNSSSDCHNLERNNNLVMTIFLQLDSEALVNSRMMWIRGTCFSQEGKKERKKKALFLLEWIISSWVKLRSTNILWLELWSSYSCEEVRHLFDKRDLSKERSFFLKSNSSIPLCPVLASVLEWCLRQATVLGLHTERYVMQRVIRQDWN